MEITLEFLTEQKQKLTAERAKAFAFIANIDGGLSMLEVMMECLKKDKEVPAETAKEKVTTISPKV